MSLEKPALYRSLSALAQKPEPFSASTVKELWTKPHLARRMLEYHLSQQTEHASRPLEGIDRIVSWLDGQLDLPGKRIVDLGCGPGLYAQRIARLGGRVTGIDFSSHSLDYARSQSPAGIDYIEADYLEDPLPDGFDVAMLIYFDYCALAPEQRILLLKRIRRMLRPGGHLVMDLAGMGAFDEVSESLEIHDRLMDGFFAPGDYVGIHKVDVYEDECISLDRFLVIEPDDAWLIYNWVQYFTPDSIGAELGDNRFAVKAMIGGLDGTPLESDSKILGVIAEMV
jgi:SAM-dependent methyltransferase